MKANLFRILLCLFGCALGCPVAAAGTIEFETTEVTQADVALSPDGQTLIFTMLGHLFRLPVEGGTAEQLTFGPYYDSNPVFSPDGTRVALTSDRDGSESNVFVLELATGKITQVTREPRAIRPTWTPDGQAIVYLRPVREAAHYWNSTWGPLASLVRRVSLDGGEPETLSASPREIRSLFYLTDGRLAWTVLEREPESARVSTRIEVMSTQGKPSTLRLFEGIGDRVVVNPTGDGLYCRRVLPLYRNVMHEHLLSLPLPEGRQREIVPVSGSGRGWGTGRWYWGPTFAVSADDKTLYVGDAGRLWKIALPSNAREPIDFRARVKLETRDLLTPPKWAPPEPGSSAPPRVLTPMLSPDGGSLVFEAAGHLWEQSLDNGPAQRLFAGSALESDAALSPDGTQLAFVRIEHGKAEIRIFDFESGKTRSLAQTEDPEYLSWSPDGQHVAFTDGEEEVKVLDLASGQTRTVASGEFHPHLSWSADAQQLIFCDHDEDGTHRVVAVNLSDGTRKMLADDLPRDARSVRLSADGESLYFSANSGEIWVASLERESSREADIRRLSQEEGNVDSFAFTPDGAALIYSSGNRVWLHPLDGGEREPVPVRLELHRPTPPPVLVRRVRVLDFASGGFGPETSLYIEQGRIRWIGSERERQLPPRTAILDAAGRFAIPGLFDMHQHSGAPEAFVAYGVTSVRNVGAGLHWLNVLADWSETTRGPMPRYFYAGDVFYGARGTGRVAIGTEDEARSYVRRWKDRGAHFIKIMASVPWPLQRAVADEARRQGLPVVAHGEDVEEATKGVALGYWTFEHIGSRERFYDDVLQMLARAGARWCPTLGEVAHTPLLLREEPDRLGDPKLWVYNQEQAIREAQSGDLFRAVGDRALRGYVTEAYAGMHAAHRRGVKLLPGSHASGRGQLTGVSLHWELEYFVNAGIEPLEVLRLATQEGAATVGADDDLGTLEPGKLADLVLLDANPLEDIKNTQTIWRVIKGGWLFDPDKLRPPESAVKPE